MTYHIARDGQQQGTFSENDVRTGLSDGHFRANDLCWTEGMPEWKPLGAVFATTSAAVAAISAPASVTTPLFTPNVSASANPYAPPSADIRTQLNRLPLASLGQRFGASMLDGVIGLVLCIPLFLAIPMMENVGEAGPGTGTPPEIPANALNLMGISGVLLLLLFAYTIYLLSVKGQTLGKKMLGIRIVNNLDDSNAGFVRAFLLRGLVNGLIGAIVPFYWLVDICFIFNAERRCLHDFIGGTRVIQG